ncbi:hypothetical protein [Halalkalibacter alkaliphilus]|uniref:Uncharacterized protein n=1 Tax=Halalkalibacter alkaliphilus TaxID=2917993 RepID=A0A9X2I5X0_9BACI|nr:hypothetical protein [Halalkalibacter alkaliphilus]MCL7748881.1 hypothetical protein [Halalkalibacter alkaliphilus]
MTIGLSFIAFGLIIGFITYSYVGLLYGLIAAIIIATIVNQLIYKKRTASDEASFTK